MPMGESGPTPAGLDQVLEISMLEATRESGFAVALPELALAPRNVVALLGPSGCGKSTLLLGMLGLLPGVRCTGTLRLGGVEVPVADRAAWQPYLRERIVVVPQDAKAALDPLQTIGTQIRAVTDQDAAACDAALSDLMVEDPERISASYPHQVSGGQAQKALLAIALLREPALVVADEPSASLDEASVRELLHNLRLLRERHATAILFSTHDIWLVGALHARCFVHQEGRFVHQQLPSGPWPSPAAQSESRQESTSARREVLLQCKDVHVAFGAHEVLRGVTLELCAGQIVAVVGPSGCGKTTLARVLSGLRQPDSGWVARAHHTVQMLFQEAYASLTPHRTILDLVRETAAPGFSILAEAVRLGLSVDHLAHTAKELSAGQRRRAALLRALSVEPRVLILDEPTASLDHGTAAQVMSLLLEVLERHRLGCLLITHDRSLARTVAHEMMELVDGVLC